MAVTSDCIYGINPVFEVVRAGRRQISRVWLNKDGGNNPRLRKLAQFLDSRQAPVAWVDRAALFDLCGSREHQGAVIEASAFEYTPFVDMLESSRLVLLDSIEDPHNVGAIMRSAEAFGWENVLLPRRGSPLILPSVVKASAGACEHLRVAVNCSANQYMRIAQEAGYAVVALDASGKVSLEDVRAAEPEKLLLVVGGEDSGVSQFIINNAEYVAAIAQKGRINSLNASVAAALALYVLGG
ncbi:MAG: RNA methyltransferase [Lentisphaerae bacterium]|jgi:23S rRNA (guanosine2251-2'-O)-methyltransferase|nr:RNA methyltransferase [Lentisphaerota bacterium]